MRRMVEKMMACYGRTMEVHQKESSTTVRGFFQPATGKVERLVVNQVGPLGTECRERYIYIGPADPELCRDDLLTVDGKLHRVCSAHIIWGDGQPVYCWAICVEKGSEALWESNG